MELNCRFQTYDWGKVGSNSLVAKLLKSSGSGSFSISESTPYAELWMGTHPNGESIVKGTETTLHNYLLEHPDELGTGINIANGDLPFLFKVLSIEKALSIQVHPDKKTAEQLHLTDSVHYKDSNHKPELAIALTPFTALCGFRPVSEIKAFINEVPELKSTICHKASAEFQVKENIKTIFEDFMFKPTEVIKNQAKKLVERLSSTNANIKEAHLFSLVEKLNKQHPDDIGIFSIYFLNVVHLMPGEAIFINAGMPHAYIEGDCIECMACSDNVVRAGLTPKFRDVTTLCHILDYKSYTPDEIKFKGERIYPSVTIFQPPVIEFSVKRIQVNNNQRYSLPCISSGSILIVVAGEGDCVDFKVYPGAILFIKANTEHTIKSRSQLIMFQAYSN